MVGFAYRGLLLMIALGVFWIALAAKARYQLRAAVMVCPVIWTAAVECSVASNLHSNASRGRSAVSACSLQASLSLRLQVLGEELA